MNKKYVIFKDDDVGKDLPKLKRWIDIIVNNGGKATIGVIGKYLKDENLVEYLLSLDKERIELFCHGFSHSFLPFLLRKAIGRNRFSSTEFDRNKKSHNKSLKKFRSYEKNYLDTKTIVFGPPGNTWNKNIIDPLIKNDFKLMFSWRKVGSGILTIPLTDNFKEYNLEDFIEKYKKNKEKLIYTLQFHHANLSDKQFETLEAVIDFLKNKEKRIFLIPSELLKIKEKDTKIDNILSNLKIK